MAHRECTPEEAERWTREHSDGYATGRSDGRWSRPPRIQLIEVPPDLPCETGSQWAARHLESAWAIGYSSAYRYAREHDLCTSYA